MSGYVHLGRYGKPRGGEVARVEVIGDGVASYLGRSWDLRTGTKSPFIKGFFFSGDGRHLEYGTNCINIVHRDGKVVPFKLAKGHLNDATFVGPYLVIMDGYSEPRTVLDETGKVLGRLTQKEMNPHVFNPRDGKTLWLGEGAFIAQHDVATRKVLRKLDAPRGSVFVGLAVTPSGYVITTERDKSDADTLVVYDPSGKRSAARPDKNMGGALLDGDRYVASDFVNKRFVVYDLKLDVQQEIPMFEPGRDGHNAIIALPSGREWLAVGGRGEWDHYGEPGLGASGAPAMKQPAAKKLAATKPAAKKPAAKKPAAKKPAAKQQAAKQPKPSAKKPAASKRRAAVSS